MNMNRWPMSIENPIAAAGSACLLGLCLVSGAGCNQSHCPAITSPAQAASTAQVDPTAGDDESHGSASAATAEAVQTAPAEKPVNEVATKDITFDALKFDIKSGDAFERSMIPKLTEELHGKPIRIRGYILPESAFSLTDLPGFILTRDSDTCCFGPNRALCDFIMVHMNPGRTADFSNKPIAVEGVFSVELLVDPADPQGAVGAIYRLDAELAR